MLKAVSLFTGCGGSDAGLLKAGFQVVMANDVLPYAKDVYLANHPSTEYVLADIQTIKNFPQAELLVGCYPCQGFSQGGLRKADRKINYLYLDFARALREISPKAFIVENVSGMIRSNFEHLLMDQRKVFTDAGYEVSMKVLNASDFGVAQDRKRIFIVGTRKDLGYHYEFPAPTHGPGASYEKLTIKEALKYMRHWPTGEYYDSDFHWYYMSRNRRCDWDGLSKTIVANARHMPLHPISPKLEKVGSDAWRFVNDKPARRFSYKEAARLQGFEKDFRFPDTEFSSLNMRYTVVGNAVPPPLFEAVAKNLLPLFLG